MQSLTQGFYILALVFLALGFIFNVYPNVPRLPGDINIDRPGIKIYIPVISAIVLSIILTIFLKFLGR